jgi:phage FluMu protein Com
MEVEVSAPDEKRCSKCKEVKGKDEFHKDKTKLDGLGHQCKACRIEGERNKRDLKRSINRSNLIICPTCKREFDVLTNHTIQVHGVNKESLRVIGITETITPELKIKYVDNGKKPKPSQRRGDVAEIKSKYISFPISYWPSDCKFVRVKVVKEKLQIQFNPLVVKTKGAKTVFKAARGYRMNVYLYQSILDSLHIIRPLVLLRKGAGFYIQLLEEDKGLFDIFEFWSKSSRSTQNLAGLTTYYYKDISIADHLWPINAEYAYLEWHPTTRKNGNNYLDVVPVTRAERTVKGNKLRLNQYLGLEDCLKVRLIQNRIWFRAIKFFQDTKVPPGDWDLKEILPSGALRFRLYKERNQLEGQIAS